MNQEPTIRADLEDELRPEYEFDYRKAKPNRFAAQQSDADRVVIVLDPDVARIFRDQDSVNAILRALIQNMPAPSEQAT